VYDERDGACMRACVRLLVESVIDLFREEAGISGFREGSVQDDGRRREKEIETVGRRAGRRGGGWWWWRER